MLVFKKLFSSFNVNWFNITAFFTNIINAIIIIVVVVINLIYIVLFWPVSVKLQVNVWYAGSLLSA